jgi:D-alanyl-D-alanine carboxypeptidase
VSAIPVLVLAVTLLVAVPAAVAAAQPGRTPALSAEAALLIDPRGEVLYAKNPAGDHAPASLVKLMTLYLACEAIQAGRLGWDDQVIVSTHAAQTPRYRMGLRAGESVPFRTLLEGVAIASANDAATAVAEHVAGSEDEFVAMMNAKAEALGLRGTRFANAHGLPDPAQRSTAQDMARLTDLLTQDYPASRGLLGGASFMHRGKTHARNIPLFNDPGGVQALKTGYTREAGYNLAVTAWRSGERFLLIVLGAQTRNASFRDARLLLQYGFHELGLESISEAKRPTPTRKAPPRRPVRAKVRAPR